jgi:hypothetical protein
MAQKQNFDLFVARKTGSYKGSQWQAEQILGMHVEGS